MVLGVSMKTEKSPSIEVDYVVHIVEVKPWPPSQSLRRLGSVVIHWEHSDGSCGFTNQAVPGNGRIEFNECFGVRENGDSCIEFNLYEPRWDKGLKGQLLASVVLDLGAYGVVEKGLSITTPIHCKRTYRNAAQPLLFLKIEPASSLLRESVSSLMSEEYAEEASSTTDHDQSSPNAASSALNQKIAVNGSAKVGKKEQATESSSSVDLSSDIEWISRRIGSHSSAVKEADKRLSSNHREEEGIVAAGKRDAKIRITSEASMIKQNSGCGSSTSAEELLVDGRTNSPPLNKSHVKRVEDEEEEEQFENEVRNIYPQVEMHKGVTLENGVASSTRRNHHVTGSISSERKVCRMETRNLVSEGRIQQLENRIKILEGELREAAALEVSLYSVVAEHGSSMSKVHAPARRLSRLYFNASKQNPKSGRESASESIVSGLVLAAKACGNDVPRLTFWLSNAIVLRAMISKSFGDSTIQMRNSGKKKSSAVARRGGEKENLVDALEKAQGWIFSRIIESLWWQTFTPHMQCGGNGTRQQQGNFSVKLWKKAFKDACERICPVRGGGHDCGCLPILSKLIMEQLVARLDVAMFNAILRESADEIPTNPLADPITDANVLPVPPGKPSFGAGAQLKNAIGNWSRWLTDLFGMDGDDKDEARSPKPFSLLNALSDLMMLPKDMLLTPSIRKEVCPTFGLPLLTRILNSFIPDEFCPDPVPAALLQALSTQDLEQDSLVNLPCEAAPIVYQPPSPATVLAGRSELNKSQTSDDELDQLNSPLKSLTLRSSVRTPSCVRYQLLRQVWKE
ncbi:uncharacterized protein LOC125194380 isoform X2 [Salvia hispanica]|uniref:uncharacterized protein LOC125194380 isoform X2 n=1 Tax=Salvia hispanica TaxID=49212 RepID=UPI002008F89D|nr:uncharacterized protein LOC125194380 isoform X2 [Salvia hispanica]